MYTVPLLFCFCCLPCFCYSFLDVKKCPKSLHLQVFHRDRPASATLSYVFHYGLCSTIYSTPPDGSRHSWESSRDVRGLNNLYTSPPVSPAPPGSHPVETRCPNTLLDPNYVTI